MPPETVIRSRQNPIYKQVRSLLRRDRRQQERAFLVEGPRFVLDALRFDAEPITIVLSESCRVQSELPSEMERVARIFDDELFSSISDTVTSQGVIGVFAIPVLIPPIDTIRFMLIADGIQDPGNLGTLIRSAAGAGVTEVITLPGSADAWAPKTVRAAAAAHFILPISAMTIDQLGGFLPTGTRVIGADAGAARAYDRCDLTGPLAIVIGSEAHGIGESARKLISEFISIPLEHGIESLNAGVAGSLILFEGARQRRIASNLAKTPAFS